MTRWLVIKGVWLTSHDTWHKLTAGSRPWKIYCWAVRGRCQMGVTYLLLFVSRRCLCIYLCRGSMRTNITGPTNELQWYWKWIQRHWIRLIRPLGKHFVRTTTKTSKASLWSVTTSNCFTIRIVIIRRIE